MEVYINVLLWTALYMVSAIIIVLVKPKLFDTRNIEYAELYEFLLFMFMPVVALIQGLKYYLRQP